MANNVQIAKIADIVDKAPLEEIIDTIEIVADFVPVIGSVAKIITKVLRILMKIQPAASKTMHGFSDMQRSTPSNELEKYKAFIPTIDTPALNQLRTMVDIALEDGELEDDEIAILNSKATECCIDLDVFNMGLRNALKKANVQF